MSLYEIIHIAGYEAKLQSRGWLVRGIILVTLVCLVFFHISLQGRGVFPHWNMVALSSSMPLLNSYMYNIVQALLVIFVVTDLRGRERRFTSLGAVEVRPYDNSLYLWGKLGGIAWVFVLFNVLSLFICVMLNVFGSDAPFQVWPYLFYLFTLTIPSLVFMMGLGVWLTYVMPSRYLSQMVLVGVWILSVAWLGRVAHGTFDFLGSSLPNLFSDVTGHVMLGMYLFQRLVYLLIGIGLMCLCVPLLSRVPNDDRQKHCFRYIGVGLLVSGVACCVGIEVKYARDNSMREEFRASFENHWNIKTSRVARHDIVLKQSGCELSMKSTMVVYNPNGEKLDRLVFFLNPGLQVRDVKEGAKSLAWKRDHQVLSVERMLAESDSVHLQIEYDGRIDERFSDLDCPEELLANTSRGDHFFNFGRATSFVSDRFILLSPSCAWYPVAIPPVDPEEPSLTGIDFTRFSLEVHAPRQKVLLSQGVSRTKEGKLFFTSSNALPGISLCGGDYELKELKTEELNVCLLYFRKHDFFKSLFAHLEHSVMTSMVKTLPEKMLHSILRKNVNADFEGRNWYEPTSRRLFLIETPLAFDAIGRGWSEKSERVQPGMVFLPERGVGLPINMLPDRMKGKIGMSNEKFEENEFYALISGIFEEAENRVPRGNPFLDMIKTSDPWAWNEQYRRNPYYIFSLLKEPDVYVYSNKYPYVDVMLKTLLRRRGRIYNTQEGMDMISRLEFELAGRRYLKGKTIGEIFEDRTLDDDLLREVIYLKSKELLNRLTEHVSYAHFFDFLDKFYAGHKGTVSFSCLSESMNRELNINVESVLAQWYACRHDARFKVKDMLLSRYRKSSRGIVEFKVLNDGEMGGWLTVTCWSYEGWKRNVDVKRIYVEAGKAQQVRIAKKRLEGYTVDFGLSCNFPSKLEYSGSPQILGVEAIDEEESCSCMEISSAEFAGNADEIIVDNEDEGFEVIEPRWTILQRLLKGGEEKIAGRHWKMDLNEKAYGDVVKSYHSKKGEDGQTKAVWNAMLPETGRYEVMAWVYCNQEHEVTKEQGGSKYTFFSVKESVKFNYTVSCGNEKKEVEVETIRSNVEKGMFAMSYTDENGNSKLVESKSAGPFHATWISLGVYDFQKGKTSVVLDDRGEPDDTIYADAVKWVRVR